MSRRPWLVVPILAWLLGMVLLVATPSWIGQPFAGFRHLPFEIVSSGPLATWSGVQAGLQPDDHVTRVNQAPLGHPRDLRERVVAAPVGTPFVYEVDREGQSRTLTIPTQPFTALDYMVTTAPYMALGLLYIVIGVLPYWLQPASREARIHMVWAACMGVLFFLTIDIDTTQVFPHLYFPAIAAAAASTIHLALVFPRPFAWLERHPWIPRAVYFTLVPLGGLAAAWYALASRAYDARGAATMVTFNHLGLMLLALAALGLVGAVAWKAFGAARAETRDQARVVLWGAGLAFVPYLALWALPFVMGIANSSVDFWFNTAIIAFVAFPGSIALAIVRHQLFDITLIIKRTLTYALTTSLALAGFFVLSAGLKAFFLSTLGQATDTIGQAISTAVIALLFAPLRDHTRALLDRLFDRSRYDMGQIVAAFTTRARRTVDLQGLTEAFSAAVEEALKPRYTAIWQRGDDGSLTPLWTSGLTLTQTAMMRQSGWPQEAKVYALQVGESCLGHVVLGPKRSDQAYTAVDEQLMESLTQALALSLSNAQLFDQLAGQERLKRELEIATDMQMGFLPKKAPEFHGALLSASCTPALEVGGDFYDYIQIDPYRWGVIIGDVAGKGVPAALMMAASITIFRAVAPSVPSPASTLNRMNKLINRNRPSNKMFVTAIYMIYDCRDGSVTISNAGQPKPLLNGQPVEIKGMPLGANFRMTFKETKVVLGPNDTLCAYSDGLEDVESESGEQFGPDRVMAAFAELAAMPPAEAKRTLDARLRAFAGQADPADDLTLVMLQRQADVAPLEVKTLTKPMPAKTGHATKPLQAPGVPATGPLASPSATKPLEDA